MPPPGTLFSASIGRTLQESAAGVPHGTIRTATAGQVRFGGGSIEWVPEIDPHTHTINRQHVHVIERRSTAFGAPTSNPLPKRKRFGGPDYRDPGLW
jgi:hypothetical protein